MQEERGIKINYTTGLIAEFILVLLIVVFTALHVSRAVSLCFTATFLVFVFLVVEYLTRCEISMTMLLLLLFSFLNVVINALISRQAQIGFSYFKKLIMFFCTVVFFYAAVNLKVEERGRKAIVSLAVLMGMILAGSYYLLGNRGKIAGSITLGFVNPNFAGIWLTHILFYAVYAIADSRRLWIRILCAGLSVLCLIMIYLTYARSCFVGIFVFFLLLVFGRLIHKNTIGKPIALAAAILPIVIAILYLLLVNVDWLMDLFSFLVRAGKKLDARNKLWLLALQSARANPFFGNYSGISGGLGGSQLHNTHIDVLASYGLAPFVLFIMSLYEVIKKADRQSSSFSQYTALCAFVGVIVIGAFEAALVAGSTGLHFLSGGFLILASAQREQQTSQSGGGASGLAAWPEGAEKG